MLATQIGFLSRYGAKNNVCSGTGESTLSVTQSLLASALARAEKSRFLVCQHLTNKLTGIWDVHNGTFSHNVLTNEEQRPSRVPPLVCLGLEPLAEHAKHEDVRDRCTHDRSDENRKEHSEARVLDACKPHDARIHLA